jgi:MerR family regulatory protein
VDGYTVGELARMSHVSVRTLHHYDSIGLLTPGGRTAAGYRLDRHQGRGGPQHCRLHGRDAGR